MILAEIYTREEWYDFFITLGSSAAVLSGLVFVAMAINLGVVVRDAAHRHRSISTLTGFTAIFMICAFGLAGGLSHRRFGIEWLIVALAAGSIYLNSYIQALRQKGSKLALNRYRVFASMTYYTVETVGSAVFALGHAGGLYVAATALVWYFPLLISAAWLLIVRGYQEDHKKV